MLQWIVELTPGTPAEARGRHEGRKGCETRRYTAAKGT